MPLLVHTCTGTSQGDRNIRYQWAVMTNGGLQGEHVGKGTCRPRPEMYTCSYVQRRSNRTCGGKLGQWARFYTQAQADCHEAQRTLCHVYQASAQIHAAMSGMPCSCPSTRCVYAPRTPGSFQRQTALTAGCGGRQPRAAVARDTDGAPEAVWSAQAAQKASDRLGSLRCCESDGDTFRG